MIHSQARFRLRFEESVPETISQRYGTGLRGHFVRQKAHSGTEALFEGRWYLRQPPAVQKGPGSVLGTEKTSSGTEALFEAARYRVRASGVRTVPDDALRHRKWRHEQKLKKHELETGAGAEDEAQEWRCGAEAEDEGLKTETRHTPETRGIIRERPMPNGYVGAQGFHFCSTECTRVAEHQENM